MTCGYRRPYVASMQTIFTVTLTRAEDADNGSRPPVVVDSLQAHSPEHAVKGLESRHLGYRATGVIAHLPILHRCRRCGGPIFTDTPQRYRNRGQYRCEDCAAR